MASPNNKKALAEQLKNKLNSPDYVAMPDLITCDDRHGDMLTWLWGASKGESIFKEENWISGININLEPTALNSYEKDPSPNIVSCKGLEPADWEEIVNLIQKRNKKKKQLWDDRKKNIEQKLNQQPNKLYYYWGKVRKNERADGWHSNKGMRGFATFLGGNGNGLTHHCYIAENHPVLDNFFFQTGFYIIDNNKTFKKATGHYEGGFESSSGETNPNNWKKYFETNEPITITPYQVSEWPTNNDQPTNKDNNSSPSQKLPDETETINWLINYFQINQIKEVSLENGELVIANNNNETETQQQINNEFKLKKIQNWLVSHNEKSLNLKKLKDLNNSKSPQNSPANSPKNDYVPYLVGGIIGIVLTGLIVVSYYLGKKQSKKNIE